MTFSAKSKYLVLGAVIVILLLIVFSSKIKLTPSNKPSPPPVKRSSVNFSSKTSMNSWPVYTSKNFGYTISYPPEFTVQERGKIGTLDDLVAFAYVDGGKTLTVATIQISGGKQTLTKSMIKGKDGDGNEVVVYTFPYNKSKTLTLLGTVFPSVGSSFLFDQALSKMADSLNIK